MPSPILPDRAAAFRAHKQRGGKIAAVLPIHYPRALLRAFDILPIEIWGPPKIDATRGAAHLQPYVCSVTRNALAFLLNGELDFADVLVVPHCCDSMQGLASILIDFVKPPQPVLPIYLPRGDSTPVIASRPERSEGTAKQSPRDIGIASSHPSTPLRFAPGRSGSLLAMTAFLAAEFRALYARLAEITRREPSDAELRVCIAREEAADALLARWHAERAHFALSQGDFYRRVRAREYLPAEMFADVVGATLRGCPPPDAGDQIQGDHIGSPLPILLSGIVPEPMDLFDAFDKMNARVVADDLASCGRRLYPAGASADPFVRMAESILGAPPDPTRGSAIQARLAHLTRMTRESGAKGVVFYGVKFCEPELFYLPTLRKGLQDAGIQSVAVEVDLNEGLSNQIVTRLEAFVEMIA